MHCPKCRRHLAEVSADLVSKSKYYVCLRCSQSFELATQDERPNGENSHGITVSEFLRCLRILGNRRDEGLTTRRLVRRLLLLCTLKGNDGGFHVSLDEPLADAVSRIRRVSGTSECDDMRVLLTGLSLVYLGGALGDRSTVGNQGKHLEQQIRPSL